MTITLIGRAALAVLTAAGTALAQTNLVDPASLTVALGDSIIHGGGTDVNWAVGSWFNQLVIRSRSRATFLHNAGVNGDTTNGMLNRLQADVFDRNPGKCIVAGGRMISV